MKKKHIIFIIVGAIVFLAAGIGIGYFAVPSRTGSVAVAPPASPAIVANSSTYPLLDGAIALHSTEHFIVNFGPLRSQITAIQGQYPEQTYVYFEYLNNTAVIGLNAHTLFTAASTIKVPLAMAVYKMVEEGKLSMNDSYTLQSSDLDSDFGDLYKVGAGQTYTVGQLMSIMLEQSDDTAMNALISVLKNIGITDPFTDVYNAMGWDYPPNFGTTPSYINIDAYTLSNMFVALYEGTYDKAIDSEAILNDLTQTSFNNELVAGTPSGVMVAHKVGIAAETQTYSDCGIVYAPARPYLLCIGMSSAPSESTADQFIAQISKVAYQYVINN